MLAYVRMWLKSTIELDVHTVYKHVHKINIYIVISKTQTSDLQF